MTTKATLRQPTSNVSQFAKAATNKTHH